MDTTIKCNNLEELIIENDFVCGSPLEDRNNRRLYSKEFTWSFNYKTGDCEMKEHAIGDEQWNAFASQEQCIDFCVGTCPNHLEVHYNTLTGQPQLCDAKANTGCPLGYECVQTSPFAAVCCRTKPTCPAAESIALLEKGSAKLCDPESHDSCPEQYSCQQANNLEHICCTRPLTCPDGMNALREDGTAMSGGTRHLCCKPEKKCVVPYVDFVKKRPKRCFPGDSSCPSSTSCLPVMEERENITNAADVMFFCCHSVDVFTCPDSQMPRMDDTTNRPMRMNNSVNAPDGKINRMAQNQELPKLHQGGAILPATGDRQSLKIGDRQPLKIGDRQSLKFGDRHRRQGSTTATGNVGDRAS
ncbi:Kunitz/Bovine pancreatic trypsin inhibitor domain protein [Ancylostoma ceylanicum]|uniref:Kunitz/Bovine pancreatic trypsin inhibitor domain protein n=1 Tax=Ancylostoma ceylanicum TaxID=53326 RepID=A0A0D6LN01_9BILA|nr:Kunitz/Bovine pancreatic trypsin inhibitor domain protein [Ancylostoma ceylanicum]